MLGLDAGVERAQMLASLHARMFGTSQTVCLGRFEIGARRGAGAMGVVYEARDPELDRKVALKVLRAADLDPRRVERLVVEARALAKLRHPNVVAVYEVGSDGEDRFIVMDLVQGETLKSWLRTPRTWREIVRMFIGAARGLQAAHEAGLVHRDFKPDNVLVEDGQPKVVDFGLAANVDGAEGRDDPADAVERTLDDRSDAPADLGRFTQTHGFVGTPVYMAPEQYRGQTTPAADQYAFCVALFEALEGRRPHADVEASGLEALIAARAGPVPPGLPRRAPRWLRRALARGLAPDPTGRWASMGALIAVLRRVEGSGRSRAAAVVAVLGVAGVAAGVGNSWSQDAVNPCADAASPIEQAWSGARQADLRRAFEATELAYAPDTWRRVTPLIDAYAEQWSSAATRACAADLAAPDPLPPLNAARQLCLDRRRSDLESLLATFEAADDEVVERAVDAATTIPPMSNCDEAVLLREQLERGQARSAASPTLYEQVAAANAAYRTGSNAVALREATEVVERAREAHDLELQALGSMVLAQAHKRTGALPEALDAASDAVEAAERLGDTHLRVRAQIELLAVLAEQRAFEPSKRLARFVDGAIERLGAPAALAFNLSVLQGWMLLNEGQLERSLEHFEQAEGLLTDRVDVSPSLRGRILSGKAFALENLGRHEEAAAVQRTAVELLQNELGPSTPRAIRARIGLATALSNLGHAKEGIAEAQRALEDADATLGPGSLIGEEARGTLAVGYAALGRVNDAEALLRSVAIAIEKKRGPKHPDSANGWMNLARLIAEIGKPAEAVTVLERAAKILSHTLEEDHPDFLFIEANLARAHVELGAWAPALRSARRAEALALKHTPSDLARLAEIHVQIGTGLRGMGDLDASDEILRTTLDELEETKARPGLIAVAQQALAMTQAAAGDLEAARANMRAARDNFKRDGANLDRFQVIDAWLAAHR